MRHSNTLPEFNYWPGFVDLMFNVVLSVLLITGLMVVGMLSLNMEATRSGHAVQQVDQIQWIKKVQESIEEKQLLAVLGGLLNAQSKNSGFKSNESNPGATQSSESRAQPAEITWRIGAHAVRNSTEDWNVLQQLINSTGNNIRGSDGNGVGIGINTEASNSKNDTTSTDYLNGPLSIDGTSTNGLGRKPFFLQFSPLQFRVKKQQLDDLKKYIASAPGASNWLLLSSAPAEDKSQLEAALWRLTSVKQSLIADSLHKSSEIHIRLVPLKDKLSNGSRVFVLPLFASQP
jgi:hypothetical protein